MISFNQNILMKIVSTIPNNGVGALLVHRFARRKLQAFSLGFVCKQKKERFAKIRRLVWKIRRLSAKIRRFSFSEAYKV